ncbi:MAG TPA: MFS transporter [Pyrinomonadaceae bacterium]
MVRVLCQRNFLLLWFGQLVSAIGDLVLFIALPFYVYEQTGSTLATGAMLVVSTLPRLLFGSLAGVLVDRWDRKLTMIAADLLRASVLLLLLLVPLYGWLWLIYPVSFLLSSISQFFRPAKNAIVPQLVDKKDLVEANSLNALGNNLAILVGPSLGGALLGYMGLITVILIDVTSFLISGLLIALITHTSDAVAAVAAKHNSLTVTWAAIWSDWLKGLNWVKQQRVIMGAFFVSGIGAVAQGIINVLLIVFIKDVLHAGALEFGWLATAQGGGSIIGGAIIAVVGRFFLPQRMIALGHAAVGIILLLLVRFPFLPLVLGLSVLQGIPVMALSIGLNVLFQSRTSDVYMGRVFGTYDTTQALLEILGMTFAGIWGYRLGAVPMLEIAAGLYFSAGLAGLAIMRGKMTPTSARP